jgi:beta-glucanase (GH16 family)
LNISTIIQDIKFNVLDETKDKSNKKNTNIKNYQSGMINGWNKFCFTGGILEIKAKLPGRFDIGGLWPAIWLLGQKLLHYYFIITIIIS